MTKAKGVVYVDQEGCVDRVVSDGQTSTVKRVSGYSRNGTASCILTDTQNGYIARFPSRSSCEQDTYLCMDYSQARDLVLALAEFKRELGFR